VVSFGHRALSEKEKAELQPAKAAAGQCARWWCRVLPKSGGRIAA
jgi:hypothetical protein